MHVVSPYLSAGYLYLFHCLVNFIVILIQLYRYFFMEYATADEAAEAVKTCDGYKLDKSHNFSVNLFIDFEK